MKNLLRLAIPVLLLLGSCASAPALKDSWRDPSVPSLEPKKTLVVALSAEESFRRVAEDQIVSQLAAGRAAPSYGLIAAADLKDSKQAAETARAQGFDSALVVRVLEVEKLEQHVPAAYTPVFLHFSNQGNTAAYYYPTRFDEGYTYLEKTFRVETSLYTLAEDKLVWSGVVEVRDPGSVRELAELNSGAVLPELRKLNLIR